MADESNFISGIYNYCDRWCERCEFTARCRSFATEQGLPDEAKDITNEAFFRNLKNVFAEAKEMITAKAEEFGIDIEPISDEEFAKIQERERAFINGDEIAQLAEKYAWDARPVLAAKDEWLGGGLVPDEVRDEVIEVLYWYQFFISVKIQRGLHGILDLDGEEDPDAIDDPQSDTNGSVKLALIAAERSILAWSYLMTPDNADIIRPFIDLLQRIIDLAEQKFPNARDFMRPGFDEIETVM